jgi:acetylornithine deacetylase
MGGHASVERRQPVLLAIGGAPVQVWGRGSCDATHPIYRGGQPEWITRTVCAVSPCQARGRACIFGRMIDVVALTADLLAIESPTAGEAKIVDYVSRFLVAHDWNVTVQEVTPGRGNVWASRAGGGVTLSTHLDTVRPYIGPRLAGGRLYGRGACDAKGIAAAMIAAAQNLAESGENRVDLLLVVGEEKGSDGARAANQLPATSRFLINGEPTESKLATGAKGSLRVTLLTRGRESHSAYPHLGRSAIEPMLELLPAVRALELPKDERLGDTSVNIGVIHGGTEANVIPGECEAELMFRLVGPVEDVKRIIEKWVDGRAEITWGSHIPAQLFHTIPGFATSPVSYTTDIPLLDRWGTPLLFGPGSIHVAHTPDEHIAVDELRAAVGTYERLVRELLSS